MEEMLSAASLPYVTVAMKGEIRSNISLVEPDGTVTKINEAGPVLDSDELASLTAAAMSRSTGAAWIAGCGSLPPLGDQEFYANLVSESRRRHVKVAIDTSGLALHAAVNCHPDLIKPNVEELAAAADCALRTVGDVVDAAESLRRRGVGAVLASIGPDGAILVDASGALHGEALLTNVLSAVGAGDALLAGFLAAGGHGVDALRTGLAWASSAVQHEGTLYSGTPTTLPVRVHERINRERRLTDPPQKQPEPRVRLPGHS
jgi:1-phosphofructokinase